ncbi:hypothetical protein [Enterococcus sp.]|uniref:hypothetical protein n=1 Tax=Enterococcus sp. TaxID=35783 RepID=UPI002898A44A|nr:hypothetical protein [Enterococcus sp.]
MGQLTKHTTTVGTTKKAQKAQRIASLEKFVKYSGFALAAFSLVLKIAKERQN